MIKRRLDELDKLQKQISVADAKEFKKLGNSENHLSEEGQKQLREKLMELTEQMKTRWKESRVSSAPVLSVKETNQSKDENGKSKSNLLPEAAETGVLSISEVSDATEIKSLSENPRNNLDKTNESSLTWNERLMEDIDDTKYKSLNLVSKASKINPTTLTDEIPERDSDCSKSVRIREIVSQVFERHKSDLEYIRSNVSDVEVPNYPTIPPGEKFEPKFPTILSNPFPKPVPNQLIGSDQSNSTADTEKAPVWIEVTKDQSDYDDDGSAGKDVVNNLSATVYKGLPKSSDQVISNESFSDVNGISKKPSIVLSQEPPIAASSPEIRTSDSNVVPDISGSQSMAISEGKFEFFYQALYLSLNLSLSLRDIADTIITISLILKCDTSLESSAPALLISTQKK